ncbi:MAG: aminotransferase class I/II-fold pyridoxal phosphate-dependent enzyme [Ignavibacteria bacterium]|nr:aminotransferase class I/II-fold pyridoxal phosphate-dependent enzyme [Ignavibacteria bacterium]
MKNAEYKKAIASVLECEVKKIFLYWKGRVALFAALTSMGVKKGDEVILPAYTCVVVPNAILYLGAIPIYVDISEDDYNLDISKLENAITSKTKVIICQNTFGLSTNLEQILRIAKKNNIFTIEDCTHGFGGYYDGKPNGSFCDAAYFSTQWNKPISTGIGGILLVNNKQLLDGVIKLESKKIKPTIVDTISLSLLLLSRKLFINKYSYYKMVNLYRILGKYKVVIGSSEGAEITSIEMPVKYFKDMSNIQMIIGTKNIVTLKEINERRKNNSIIYTQFLKNNGKKFVAEKYFENHLFLKYPLIVKNRDLFIERANKENIILGDWFNSPIHPIKKNLHLWQFEPELFPIAMEVSKKIVNLPTELKNIDRVMDFLRLNLDFIQ